MEVSGSFTARAVHEQTVCTISLLHMQELRNKGWHPLLNLSQGIPLDKQRLIFQGKVLKGDQQLKDYGEWTTPWYSPFCE